MKAINLIIGSFLLISTCFAQQDLLPAFPREISYQGERAFLNGSPFTGILVSENTFIKWGEFRNGYKNGIFTEFYTNGNKKSEGHFVNGIKKGLHSEWYENGKKNKEQNYVQGNLDGKSIEWYSNGQIKVEYLFLSGGIKTGYYTSYFENGQKHKQEYYIGGILKSEGTYEGDYLFKKSVEYYPEGQKKVEGFTKNGLRDGIWTEWFNTGEKKKELKYVNGTITSVIYENTSLVTDIDDNVYHTVTIGKQVWMVENLKTTKYSDGTSITNITNNAAWVNLTTGAYCDYDNAPSNSATYGRLYNWYAATDARNICPTGWHIPSETEWATLITYLGGDSIAGGKLNDTGTIHWKSPNIWATNETGFTALPGGFRFTYHGTETSNYQGTFNFVGDCGNWWSSTEWSSYGENSPSSALIRMTFYNYSKVARGAREKTYGISIRCMKD